MHRYGFFILQRSLLATSLTLPLLINSELKAQTQWTSIEDITNGNPQIQPNWKPVVQETSSSQNILWEPLTLQEESLSPEELVWTKPKPDVDKLDDDSQESKSKSQVYDEITEEKSKVSDGFRWPNGQLMSEADQIYYRTAYSRGSMIQIGDIVYPNLGFNALQRHPDSWINAAIVAIDDSRISGPDCKTGDFFGGCSDGLLEGRLKIWNSKDFTFDIHWTMHSLSGEGAPFDFSIGDQNVGGGDTGTKFGEGQSIGFVASKNLGKTFGLTFAGYRLFHFDEVTDLPRNFALYGTKVFLLSNSLEPPIISVSLGLMTDVYNTNTNIGSITYPKVLRGGQFRSLAAAYFGKEKGNSEYYEDVAGVSSAFVCADQTVFAPLNGKKFKPLQEADPNCIKQVYLGPIASIGYAPWPWLGVYAKYGGTDIDLGISLKPFKNIPWTFSLEALNPIKGVNTILDSSYDFKECRGKDNSTFSDCRTRVGIYTELAF